MSYDKIICSKDKMAAYLQMELSLNSNQGKQVQKELDAYVLSRNYPLNPILVDCDYCCNITFFISGSDHEFDCEEVAILGTIMHELFQNGNMCELPMIEILYMANLWDLEPPELNDEGDENELLRRICGYPSMLIKALYEIDPSYTKKVMIDFFEVATGRSLTDEEISHIDAAIVEQIMSQD